MPTAKSLAELRAQRRVWNHAPFGWTAEDGRLVPDPAEQETLARATELRAAGQSYAKIAATLIAERPPTKHGGAWQAIVLIEVVEEVLVGRIEIADEEIVHHRQPATSDHMTP